MSSMDSIFNNITVRSTRLRLEKILNANQLMPQPNPSSFERFVSEFPIGGAPVLVEICTLQISYWVIFIESSLSRPSQLRDRQ